MRRSMRMYVLLAACVLHVNSHGIDEHRSRSTPQPKEKAKTISKGNVLLISFDSFGWKYLNLVETPVLDTFKQEGVHADYMLNVIPTETFPNHVSLATGLYPESHGIVSNNMYDPVFKDFFNMKTTDPKWWWGGGVEPLWYTNEKQGGISGVVYWPGYNIKNYTPIYWNNNTRILYKHKVDLAISWLKSDKPPNFLMLYFGMLDHAGHKHGFASPQTLQEVRNIDNITGYLIEKLSQNDLMDKWNIILTADHGMTNTSHNKVMNITDYVNTSDCIISGDGGIHFVWPKKGMKNSVYEKLKAHHHPHMQVWLKENFPQKYHYRNNRRVPPILLTIDKGWTLIHNLNGSHSIKNKGSHGYLNTEPSMWPIFFARGPAFMKGYHSKTFNSVDLYPLMCKLLNINANPNNGSYSAVKTMLLGNVRSSFSPILIGIMVSSMFFALGVLICLVTICLGDRKAKKKYRKNRAWNNNVRMSQLEQSDKLLLNEEGDDDDDPIPPPTDTL